MSNKQKTILMIDDDKELAKSVEESLSNEGYNVHIANDGQAGVEKAYQVIPDLVIVDINLPKMNGFEVCMTLREEKKDNKLYNTPILMLTSRNEIEDKYKGFKAGTDDYLTKPFSIIELNLRVSALLRRASRHSLPTTSTDSQNTAHQVLTIGALSLNKSNFTFKKKNAIINLTKSEFSIMEYLMQNLGEVVPLKTLLYEVLEYDELSDENLVRRHILNLRRKVEEDPEKPMIIKTVQGVGYIIDMDNIL